MIDDDKCYTSLAPGFQKDIVGRRLHSWLKGIKSMTHVILFWSLLDEFGDSQFDRLKITRIELCCCVMLRLPCLLFPVYRGSRSDIIKRYQHLVQSTALSLVTGWYLYLYRYRMIYIYTVYISNITCTRKFISSCQNQIMITMVYKHVFWSYTHHKTSAYCLTRALGFGCCEDRLHGRVAGVPCARRRCGLKDVDEVE